MAPAPDPAIELLAAAADVVPLPRLPQPIVIAGYGTVGGRQSMAAINVAITRLRRRTKPEHPVLVAHTDCPDSDFSGLFQTLTDAPDSYLHRDAATFASAVGRSFYQQILPSNSVTLGWTAGAIQRLSPPESGDGAGESEHAKQAARDWHDFVAFRGRELGAGGRLVVLTAAAGDSGPAGYRPLFDGLAAELADLRTQGVLTRDEAALMSIPVVGRREADLLSPFAPSGRFEQLSVEHLDIVDGDDVFWDRFVVDRDAVAFGARWAAFARTWLLPALVARLATDDQRRVRCVERLETGLATRLAAAPERMRIPLAHVVLAKSGG